MNCDTQMCKISFKRRDTYVTELLYCITTFTDDHANSDFIFWKSVQLNFTLVFKSYDVVEMCA